MQPRTLGLKDLITGLRHVGFITTDLEASLEHFTRIYGLEPAQIRVVPPFGEAAETRFAFIDLPHACFELIEPISQRFREILLKDRPGINHVAFNVSNLEAALALLEARGIRPGHVTPSGIVELPSYKMAYLDPADTGGMLIELIEPKA